MAQEKAPALVKREGFECLLAGDNEANSLISARIQALLHLGLTLDRAALLAGLIFGEGREHG
jgi:hypothetical protein